MNIITKIRLNITDYILNRKIKKNIRVVNVCNIKDAGTAVIIYNSADENNVAACKNMEHFLKSHNVKYQAMGFNNTKTPLTHTIGDSIHQYITKKDFSYFYQPILDDTKEFINKSFDIMFNIYQDESSEIESIVRLSKARFKLGSAHFNPKIHDLMLEIKEENRNPNYIAEQMQHYISIINQ